MSIEIHVPDIGADEVEVTEILVSVGDTVEAEQSLITVEGDKASMEIPASEAGVVKSIEVKTGDSIKTGSLIMLFEAADGDSKQDDSSADKENSEKESTDKDNSDSASDSDSEASSEEKDVEVPDIGGDDVEVTEILVAVGDSVEAEQSLLTVEGDKASMEVPAPFAGTVKSIKVSTGDRVKTGSHIMVFEVAASGGSSEKKPSKSDSKAESSKAKDDDKPAKSKASAASEQPGKGKDEFVENDAYAHASPAVRRVAREFGVNLAKVKGTGRKNRVLREDVQNYVKEVVKKVESGAVSSGGGMDVLAWPKVDFSRFGEVEEKPLSRIQKISGANLHRNWVRIPHVTQFDEADITGLEDFRKEQNQLAEKKKLGVKYTPLVFIMKAVAKALEEFPTFNSSLSDDGQSLILKKYVHLGIAVDTPNGLVVPVVRDVNKKGVIELSRELMDISVKAREGKLTSADMQGGCFTISSLGGIGGTAFTPIVNAPEVAILGVSKSEIKPKWNGKEFEPKLMLPLSVSYDHRVIDGALAARFTATLAGYLADIRQIIM
ncbi:dihydrolipoyllysine-residue acetyltransferase [Alkalimonas collagenimarina]|uniref:Acetyltransferase component of pyruvate dehydrogenase complex n=1 Tax=Alkalimonas collagenimarina TaxID=400390 RepID=A0ABT9GWZ8_9GAMM|nr:dihydrolipoyllysine-residue acetyltransferase [Alkalimonas collagenimarina]MDP4535389.1 dihydrolipoyllysine-residue acetyltransferase [Alkalimonas collagenimarina]